MTAERLEVLESNSAWLVTNHRQAPRHFLSSDEAVAMATFEAKRIAAGGVSVEVHLWRHGQSTVVFSAGPQGDADNRDVPRP